MSTSLRLSRACAGDVAAAGAVADEKEFEELVSVAFDVARRSAKKEEVMDRLMGESWQCCVVAVLHEERHLWQLCHSAA